jgi:fumarylacetoacetase
MNYTPNETHNPQWKSWVESANRPEGDFPIQNLPFGIFHQRGTTIPPRAGVAIGDSILDLVAAAERGLLSDCDDETKQACRQATLNHLMALGEAQVSRLRRSIQRTLRADAAKSSQQTARSCLVEMATAEMLVPAQIGDYTDFFASIYHATRTGQLFRADDPLPRNYKYLPLAYHGRASSIVPSGTAVQRPRGQLKNGDQAPAFAPTGRLDYELEVGFYVGRGNARGARVSIAEAAQHVFGFCLVNDWSARDIQFWEMQPLGPFLGKSFALTVSPWIVTAEALAPYRAPASIRAPGDPPPLPYLLSPEDQRWGSLNLGLEVQLLTRKMRSENAAPLTVCRSNYNLLYWTPAQMVTHHTSNGCNLTTGDLLASGTLSGPGRDSCGCLLELTQGGQVPLVLANGETRTFLEDSDEVIFTGHCLAPGFVRIGFGDCRGRVLAAPEEPNSSDDRAVF